MEVAQLERKSINNLSKIEENPSRIDPKSTLGRFGCPRGFWGRVQTRSGWLLNAQMPPRSRSWDALGEPRAARSRPKAPPGHPKDAPRASGTAPKTMAMPFASPNAVGSTCGSIFYRFSVNVRKLRSVFRIGFYSVLSMSDVLRVDRSSRGKISKKQPFRIRKSRLGASRGASDEQV